jgi:hypothetical protein
VGKIDEKGWTNVAFCDEILTIHNLSQKYQPFLMELGRNQKHGKSKKQPYLDEIICLQPFLSTFPTLRVSQCSAAVGQSSDAIGGPFATRLATVGES